MVLCSILFYYHFFFFPSHSSPQDESLLKWVWIWKKKKVAGGNEWLSCRWQMASAKFKQGGNKPTQIVYYPRMLLNAYHVQKQKALARSITLPCKCHLERWYGCHFCRGELSMNPQVFLFIKWQSFVCGKPRLWVWFSVNNNGREMGLVFPKESSRSDSLKWILACHRAGEWTRSQPREELPF